MMNDELKKEIQFEEIVILLDATYLDGLVASLVPPLSKRFKRKLDKADLCLLLGCMALDGGIRPDEASQDEASQSEAKHCIQALLIYDSAKPKLQHLFPGDLKTELNDVGFPTPMGDFVMNSYPTTEFAGRTEFYLEALKLLVDAAEVKHIFTLADENACGEEVKKVLEDAVKAGKHVRMFGLRAMETLMFETIVFALAKSLGVKSEEF